MPVSAKRLLRNFQFTSCDRNGKMLIHLLLIVSLLEGKRIIRSLKNIEKLSLNGLYKMLKTIACVLD